MDARHRSRGQAKQRLPRPHGAEALLALLSNQSRFLAGHTERRQP